MKKILFLLFLAVVFLFLVDSAKAQVSTPTISIVSVDLQNSRVTFHLSNVSSSAYLPGNNFYYYSPQDGNIWPVNFNNSTCSNSYCTLTFPYLSFYPVYFYGWVYDGGLIYNVNNQINSVSLFSYANPPQTILLPGQDTTDIGNGITISGTVTSPGAITVEQYSSNQWLSIPSVFKILNKFYNITTSASFSGPVTLKFEYQTNNPNQKLRVLHYNGTLWDLLETSQTYDFQNQTMTLTVVSPSLSPFAVVELDDVAPTLENFNLSSYVLQNGEFTTVTVEANDNVKVEEVNYSLISSAGQITTGSLSYSNQEFKWQKILNPSTGLYVLNVTAVDGAGNESLSENIYLAVYNPSGGFVTGGGWYMPNESTSRGISFGGKANFGFVAKYINGSPEGNMTINYKEDSLEFKSTSLDWLTINGTIADFQGKMITADGQVFSFRTHFVNGSSDQIDVRIWDNGNSFDNPDYRISNSLSGGNIIVHQ